MSLDGVSVTEFCSGRFGETATLQGTPSIDLAAAGPSTHTPKRQARASPFLPTSRDSVRPALRFPGASPARTRDALLLSGGLWRSRAYASSSREPESPFCGRERPDQVCRAGSSHASESESGGDA